MSKPFPDRRTGQRVVVCVQYSAEELDPVHQAN